MYMYFYICLTLVLLFPGVLLLHPLLPACGPLCRTEACGFFPVHVGTLIAVILVEHLSGHVVEPLWV